MNNAAKLSSVDVDALSLYQLENLIYPPDGKVDVPHCAAALVLGTDKPNVDRTPEAVACYKAGLCDKLVFSGGVFRDTEYGRLTEAEYMMKWAVENGVPEKDIVLDNMARTTIENMLCGAIALHRAFTYISEVKELLIVTSDFHMRRSMLIAKATLPRFMRLYPRASKGSINADNWKDSERGIRRIRGEAGFIKAMIVHGMTEDIDLH